MDKALSCVLHAPSAACRLRKPDAGRRLASAQVPMFGQVGATFATSFMPFGDIAITDNPAVLFIINQDGMLRSATTERRRC